MSLTTAVLRAVIMHLLAKVGVARQSDNIVYYVFIAGVHFVCTGCSLDEIS